MSTSSQALKQSLLGLAILIGGGVFVAMGYAMWMMMGYMAGMRDYMASMNESMTAMTAMSGDMKQMRIAMVNMGGTPEQIVAGEADPAVEHRGGGPDSGAGKLKATPHEMAAVDATCEAFLQSVAADGGPPQFKVDDARPSVIANESYMASMRRDMREMDAHMFCMYLSMSADMAEMRKSMSIMTPSVASMGPTMNYMGYDMNRGVSSFSNPMNYMFNAFR
ncbi:MAG: hypothetical protein LJE69_03940 [Thiohalocapsa sp.]|uniref:hypothetical protein n=1 Tax=Thiohalocapsa sp. TaxID=2497641 RepID=UPI0025F25D18|nr:hypothetical protein [Thiohalocapsa sp.]MCG6940385.1 hypothetical protein [Thiohalocapsa sp.]